MKTLIYKIAVFILIVFSSCTDVVDVDVPNAEPRLVVEASIDWEKGTPGNEQSVKLSMSTPFFNSLSVNTVSGASVKITNNTTNEVFIFADMNNGEYIASDFVPVLNQAYTLEINYNGQTYIAEEKMTPVVDIDEIRQAREGGFNDDALEVDIFFNDPLNEENYYFFRFQEEGDLLPELLAIPDEFTGGNRMKVFYEKLEDEAINQDEFKSGDIANINFHGISKQYFNYVSLLIDQYENLDNPFGTVPASLRGNVINPSSPDNYAFGYFRLTQVVYVTYVFQ